MTLLNEADKIYLSNNQASAVYAGTHKVWPQVSLVTFDPAHKGADINWDAASPRNFNINSGAHESILSTVAAKPAQKVFWRLSMWFIGFRMSAGFANYSFDVTFGSIPGLSDNNAWSVATDGQLYVNGTAHNLYSGSWVTNDIMDLVMDFGAMRFWVRKNGAGGWNTALGGVQDPGTGQGGALISGVNPGPYYAVGSGHGASFEGATALFAASDWGVSPPTGFTPLG